MRVARSSARYLHTLEPTTEIPPADLFPAGKHRPVPYIYSDDDVGALIVAARTLVSPLRAATFEALLGLVRATGMRSSEGMALDRGDIDWPNCALTARDSKYVSSREVLVHPSTLAALEAYRPNETTSLSRPADVR